MIDQAQKGLEVFLESYQDIHKKMSERAFDNCDYEKKCYKECYKNQQCLWEGLIRYFWDSMSKQN